MARDKRSAPMKHQGQTGSDMTVTEIEGIVVAFVCDDL